MDIEIFTCEKCGRPLRDPKSVTLGMGPCCREGEPYVCPYEIVVDIQEVNGGHPFMFEGMRQRESKGGGEIVPSLIIRHLKTGDYTIDGLEDQVSIERKAKPDLFGTLGRGRARFERELERLTKMQFAAVVVECDWTGILHAPPPHSNVPPQSIEGSILGLSQDFPNVQWQLCKNRRHAEFVTWWLLDRFYWSREKVKPLKDTGTNGKGQMAGCDKRDSPTARPDFDLW